MSARHFSSTIVACLLVLGCGSSKNRPEKSKTDIGSDSGPFPAPVSGWSAQYGPKGAEEMESVIATPDGGILVAGLSSSFGSGDGGDALLVKLRADGGVEWAKTYGGEGEDMALDVKAVPSGGYIVVGWTESFGAGSTDCWLLRLDDYGNVQWSKAYGGPEAEQAVKVDMLPGGDYVVAAGTTSFGAGGADYWVLRVRQDGEVVWQKAYGGPNDDAPINAYGEQVVRAVVGADGNIVVGSVSLSFGKGGGDVWVLKLDQADGTPIWQYAYGGPDEDSNWMLTRATGGGYLFSGSLYDVDKDESDTWVVKLSEDGAIVWQKTLGLPKVFDEALYHIPLADGGVLVEAYFEQSAEDDWRTLIAKLDSAGALRWSKVYRNGPVSWPNAAAEVSQGLVVVGVSVADAAVYDQQMWVLRIDAQGLVSEGCKLGEAVILAERDAASKRTPTSGTVTNTSGLAIVTDVEVASKDVTLSPSYDCQ